MRKKLFFISIIVLYLSSNFILYTITYGHNSLFLLYKMSTLGNSIENKQEKVDFQK